MGRCSAGIPQGLDGAGDCGVWNTQVVLESKTIYRPEAFAGDLWDSLQPAQQPQTLVLEKAVQGAGRERGLVLHLSMKGLTANGIIKQLP